MNFAVYKTRFDIDKVKFVREVVAVFAEESDAKIFIDAFNAGPQPDYVQILPIEP